MKSALIVPISPDPVMGTPRRVRLEYFQILPDLNMLFGLRVEHVGKGQLLTKREEIMADATLNPYQKEVALHQFADRVVARQTTGSFANALTGELVTEDVPGAISQRDYFQAIKLGDLKAQGMAITDQTTLAELIYAIITLEILKSDARGEI